MQGAEEQKAAGEPGGTAARRRARVIGTALLLFALAAALRIGYVLSVADEPLVHFPMVDSRAYHERALEIASGKWVADRIAYQDPLYPYVLALLYLVLEPGSPAVLVAQALLDALTVLLVYGMARRLFDERVGVVAGVLAATYKVFFYYDAFLLKVPLSLFLLALALYALVRAERGGGRRAWGLGGLALGLACLTRGNYLLLVPVVGAWVLWGHRGARPERARKLALFAAGTAAVLLPVAALNYAVGDDFVLVTSQAGQNFYIGNNRGNSTGVYQAPPFVRANPMAEEADFRAEAERRTGREMKPSEISRFWFRAALAEIAADPAHFLRHLWQKTVLYFNHYEAADNQSFDYFAAHVAPMLRWPLPGYGFVLPLALCGMALARRERSAWLLIALAGTYSASVILFFNMSRYRLPVVPLLLVFAAFALVRSVDHARSRAWRPLLGCALFLALAYPWVLKDRVEPRFTTVYFNVGIRLKASADERRERAEALAAAGDAAAAERERAEVLPTLQRAEDAFRESFELAPRNDRARARLANVMLEVAVEWEARGEEERALEQARATVRRFPTFANGRIAYGRMLLEEGRHAEARRELETALRLWPEHPVAEELLERLPAAPTPR